MSKNTEVLNDYETLLISIEEIREAHDLLHNWLNCKPKREDWTSYHDLIALHSQHFALLNLIMDKMDHLIKSHQKSINEHYTKNRKELA
ncbi:hypothetical protein NHG24_07760 [Aerococcaceae bacterium NML210727]|nr:hypothetical protein [Aerococcaceae bacterium NML210727]MCW6655096.1 hypothetical protein [Aerococcaceae bacterium NML201296]